MATTIEATSTLATDQLARYVAEARYADLPSEVRDYAKLCILDSLGCLVGGSRTDAGRVVLDLMASSADEAIVLPLQRRAALRDAAYIGGYLAAALDFDDFYIVHPGVCAVPPALAVADYAGASGRDFLNAAVLGYEVQLRVADAITPSRERKPIVGGCSTPQVFGSAAAAASLLQLSFEQTINAFGLAGANAPIPHKTNRPLGGNPRPLSWVQGNTGWISMGGVLAAQMASAGFRGRLEILDGAAGFWTMSGSDQCNFDALTAGLGERFDILNVAFKPYAGCRYVHSSIAALEAIIARHDVRAPAVRRVLVRSYTILGSFMDYAPRTFVDGQFSLPYLLALVLLRRPTGYGWYEQSTLRDPEVLAVARKVEFELDQAAAEAFLEREYPSTVTVEMEDGTSWTETVPIPPGDPRVPLSEAALREKFRSLVGPVLGSRRAERLEAFVDGLEEVENVRAALDEVMAA